MEKIDPLVLLQEENTRLAKIIEEMSETQKNDYLIITYWRDRAFAAEDAKLTHAEWKYNMGYWTCSNCDGDVQCRDEDDPDNPNAPFCKWCGAHMDGKE